MSTLLLAAHADDETLFASYLAQRYAAHIAVVYNEGREHELGRAAAALGCTYIQLGACKGDPEDVVAEHIQPSAAIAFAVERVIAPDVEDGGHEEHNLVGRLAPRLFPDAELIRYRTYAPRGVRSLGTLVEPDSYVCIEFKLLALSCYTSQIRDPTTRPWFYDLLDMREWVAP